MSECHLPSHKIQLLNKVVLVRGGPLLHFSRNTEGSLKEWQFLGVGKLGNIHKLCPNLKQGYQNWMLNVYW